MNIFVKLFVLAENNLLVVQFEFPLERKSLFFFDLLAAINLNIVALAVIFSLLPHHKRPSLKISTHSMNLSLTVMTIYKASARFIADNARRMILFRLNVLSFDVFILNFPKIMNEKTKVMGIVMGRSICNCSYHESFFPWALADIAESCLTFLVIWSTTESTSMTSFIHFLAIFMHSHWTLWTLLNRIVHFREITETCWAWRT